MSIQDAQEKAAIAEEERKMYDAKMDMAEDACRRLRDLGLTRAVAGVIALKLIGIEVSPGDFEPEEEPCGPETFSRKAA